MRQTHLFTVMVIGGLAAAGGLTAAQFQTYDNPTNQVSPTPTQLPGTVPTAQPANLTTNRQVFVAQLNPANAGLSGATGTARVVVDGDRMGVSIDAQGLAPGMMHPQHIHVGPTCATAANDTNGDGIIDEVEAEAVSGQPIVPLTLDNLQGGGERANAPYPIPAADGVTTYINAAPLATLLGSFARNPVTQPTVSPTTSPSLLPIESPIPEPSVTPTETPTESPSASPTISPSPTESPGIAGTLGLNNRVIEIHGVDPATSLPATVQSTSGPATQTVPVACGVLVQVQE